MTTQNSSIGILGGGISGLAAAYFLQQEGYNATVYEKDEIVGGAIKTYRRNNWCVEKGPNTLMVKTPELWELLDELELMQETVEANQLAQRRYVVRDSQPLPLPDSLFSFLKTPLISTGAKLRLLKEPFIPPTSEPDESIASFIRRRLGREPLSYAVDPFISGVYAGDPRQLSVKHTFSSLWKFEQQYGSLLKGLFKKERPANQTKRALISFTKGNEMLPEALARQLEEPVQTSTAIQSAEHKNSKWHITARQGGQTIQFTHDYLVSTLPAAVVGDIFGQSFQPLSDIPYAPISSIALGFRDDQIEHPLDGFGMLIPAAEGYQTLGVLFSSTLFPGRAPADHHLLTCFIGGARHPKQANQPTDQLIEIIQKELQQLLGINGRPVFTHHQYWPQAIPQYEVGYEHFLNEMTNIENQYPSLLLEGSFRGGISVPDCISSAADTAQKALKLWKLK